MKEFIGIFHKVGGKSVLKQYSKAHVLLFALIQTAVNGFTKKSLEIVRLAVNNRVYCRLKKQNERFVHDYLCEHSGEKLEHPHAKTVWTIWLQGMDKAPKIVQRCYQSMLENIKDREIVVITEDNFSEYVDFPDYIIEKYYAGIISKVHFADLLRIELMAKYGGTWLDGTVFCTNVSGKEYILDSDLFLFQMLKPGLDGHCAAISSWLMTASANNKIILLTRSLLHNYWKTHDIAIDYFILHDFFQMAIEAYPEEWRKVIPVSNSLPHILLLRLFEPYDERIWTAVKEQTPFHKLTYKFTEEQAQKEGTYYKEVLGL